MSAIVGNVLHNTRVNVSLCVLVFIMSFKVGLDLCLTVLKGGLLV